MDWLRQSFGQISNKRNAMGRNDVQIFLSKVLLFKKSYSNYLWKSSGLVANFMQNSDTLILTIPPFEHFPKFQLLCVFCIYKDNAIVASKGILEAR